MHVLECHGHDWKGQQEGDLSASLTHTATHHGDVCTQGPAYMPAWGQPQPSPWSSSGSGDINMTIALTGPSGAALPPAAREAVQHAVAQAIPGVGAPPLLQAISLRTALSERSGLG